MPTVLFVHGTGVREKAYNATFNLIEQRVRDHLGSRYELGQCYWGTEHGAWLHGGGASVPGYDVGRGVGAILPEDEDDARWSLLFQDPLFELRLLQAMSASRDELPPGTAPAWRELQTRVAGFRPSPELEAILTETRLSEVWTGAYQDVSSSDEWRRAVRSASQTAAGPALARAIVAAALVSAEAEGIPMLDGQTRDRMVDEVVDGIGGQARGIVERASAPVLGIAAHIGTWKVNRQKRTATDRAYPLAGDVLLYQTRGQPIRDAIHRRIDESPPPIVLLAHSLGGIACVDLLASEHLPTVSHLVTVGSQAPFFYELDSLVGKRFGEALPGDFPHWLNVYDRRDFLSFVGEDVFASRVQDRQVDNGQPFPQSHSAYWSNRAVWQAISTFLD